MIEYKGKFVLAPMVRIGELPTRILSLKSGADLVWGPEIIDKKILTLKRIENPILDTIDYVTIKEKTKKHPEQQIIQFRTFKPLEKGKLIFQMGTADPELAVKAAKIIIDDVDGLDINAGCPKHFSIHSGMGAALLKTPDLLCNILTSLVEEVGKPKEKPISVKIRLLEDEEKTLELVERLVKTGISNLTLHCRRREMRNRDPPIRDYLPKIIDKCRENNVSFIVNGGIKNHQDYLSLKEQYGKDIGAMMAEAAESNPTVFSKEAKDWRSVAKEFIEIALKYDNHFANSKYCLSRIIPGKTKEYKEMSQLRSNEEFKNFLEKLNENETEKAKESDKENENGKRVLNEEISDNKKQKVDR